MTELFDPKAAFPDLALPVQDLAKLSFCAGNKLGHVQKWAGQLQATRIHQTSGLLYQSLPEIIRLKTEPQTRLAMLEALRPHVQNTIVGLSRHFLGQPLILPEPAQKAAIVAQALQKNMIDGYSLCVKDFLYAYKDSKQSRQDLALAIDRALFGIGRLYLRSCQIYTQLPKGLWLLLHRLYQAGAHFELLTAAVPDDQLQTVGVSCARDAYARPLMLACARPNQLSQQELDSLFSAFELWARNLELRDETDTSNAFAVDLSRDLPPTYKSHPHGESDSHLLEPDFSTLLRAFQAPNSAAALEVHVPEGLSPQLIAHLTAAWSSPADRRQQRQKAKTAVDVCVGLTGCHYHLAGKSFADFLDRSRTREASTSVSPADYMSQGFTPAERKTGSEEATVYSPVRVTVQNISAGGYCLHWQNKVPANVTAGQLLGIREAGQREWLIGVVRWMRQLRGASQMGVQVLALEGRPAAAFLQNDLGGQSHPMRALQLAPDRHNGMPPTLITAAIPFQESHRVHLQAEGRSVTAQLDKCLFSTGHVRQFSYQVLASGDQAVPQGDASETPSSIAQEEFDSNWD